MEQVRIALLLAFLPGLLMAWSGLSDPDTELIEEYMIYIFTMAWTLLLLTQLIFT